MFKALTRTKDEWPTKNKKKNIRQGTPENEKNFEKKLQMMYLHSRSNGQKHVCIKNTNKFDEYLFLLYIM